jgi:hypothetical protein
MKPPKTPNHQRNYYYPEHYQNHIRSISCKVFPHLISQEKLDSIWLKKKVSSGTIGKTHKYYRFRIMPAHVRIHILAADPDYF